MFRVPVAMLLVLGLFGCSSSSSSSTPDHDSGTDSALGEGGATAADGGGVCCPITNDICSGGPAGGWAASASQCTAMIGADGYYSETTDSHGCPLIEQPGAMTHCCGCPPMGDSGAGDAATDAASDGPVE